MNTEAAESKPSDFVSPTGPAGGRKKVSPQRFNSGAGKERFGSCSDWLSPQQAATGAGTPGSPSKRSWQPKDPALKNLSLFEM